MATSDTSGSSGCVAKKRRPRLPCSRRKLCDAKCSMNVGADRSPSGLDEALSLEVPPLAVVEPRRDEVAPNLVEGRVAHRREHLVERQARRHRLAHLVERKRFSQPKVLGRELLLLDAALNHANDLVDLERLQDVVVGAALHRVDRRLDRAEAGHDDGERVRSGRVHLLEQLDAPHPRHLEIADDEVVARVTELVQRRRAVLGRADDVPLHPEEVGEDVANELLVVDDEDRRTLIDTAHARAGPDARRRGRCRRDRGRRGRRGRNRADRHRRRRLGMGGRSAIHGRWARLYQNNRGHAPCVGAEGVKDHRREHGRCWYRTFATTAPRSPSRAATPR
jgi:hypothetical protein